MSTQSAGSSSVMQIIALQLDMAWEQVHENLRRIEHLVETASPCPGALLVLPEMCATGFSMNVDSVAEPQGGLAEERLIALARRWNIGIVAGLAKRLPSGRCRNEALVLGPDGTVEGRYHKLHLFAPAGEHLAYETGHHVLTFHRTAGVIAPFICYDLRFPEVFRHASAAGAQVFVVVANWPQARQAHWLLLLQARAIENQAYVVGVNRCGHDPSHEYSGRSVIVSPTGDLLADAGSSPGFIAASLDLSELEAYRARFPVLRHRRPEFLSSQEFSRC